MYLSSSSSISSFEMKRDSDSYDDDVYFDCKRPENDVFMNYSEDIGKQFISHLKGALGRRGFTISDYTMLPVGQDIRLHLLKAMEESEMYLVVFSTSYASSVRSLDELVHIMDCLRNFDQRKVLPVFYKVDPSDVRSQEGSFKGAFQDHEANGDIDSERVQKWKQALKGVGELSGLTVQNRDDEGKIVLKIVKQLEKMQSSQELHVADHPVVIGSRVNELISTLRLDCEDVLVVAVFGISGIGKTTIVKATYNKISSYFDVSCFLGDIHYRCRGPNWKIELQSQLISSLNQNDKFSTMHYHNDGVTRIKKLITRQKILLVLDDVDNYQQLKSLGINLASFYKGSRIIVITRDKQSLGIIPYTSYQTTELDIFESFNLFNRLMFSRDNNHVDVKFIKEVADLAGGLPLVLEVWSRYFTCHDTKQWPSLLEKLKRIPHGDVQKQLQMSYDSLNIIAKNLFLDIACFFERMDKELVVDVLHDEELGFFPDIEIQGLVDKFLVKYEDFPRENVAMNQVIKETGHEVVREEHPDEPGKRTRLMGHRDVVRVFRENSGTDSVRSIRLDHEHKMDEEATVELEAFKKISNLRFIMLTNPNLKWECTSNDDDMSACFSFKHLKYLEWQEFPCKSLDNIDMSNVVVIILYKSKLEKLWEGANKSLKRLKILDVSYSFSLIKTGSFIGLENLENLIMSECKNLKELDSSVGCLKKLVNLHIDGCCKLVSLPSNISGLQNLKVLNLKACKLGSEDLTRITRLRNLQELDMRNCNVSQVSSRIGNLVSLVYLNLTGNTFSSLPESFSNLSKLEKLFINGCSQLELLPPLPSQLLDIHANNSPSLDVMSFDSTQKAYIFPSNPFKESLKDALDIHLNGEKVPDWCTYQNNENKLSFVAPVQFHTKICGLILCATRDDGDYFEEWGCPRFYNKTKGTERLINRHMREDDGTMLVIFYPLNLNDTTLVVEAGDTVEVKFDWSEDTIENCGLRLVYEDDVVDSRLVLKDVRQPTLSC